MALKSKINIETESHEFEASFELFKRYQEALKQTPGQWAFYHGQIKSAANAADKLAKFYEEQNASLSEVASYHARFSDAASKAGGIFSRFSREVKETTGRLASVAGSLFSISLITGLVSGLLGGGFGMYVLDRTAFQVMERRRTALGLGLGYGQVQSFNTNFSRFGIGQETLGAVSTGLYDFTSPQYLGLIGAGAAGTGGNAAVATVELLRRLPQIFAGVPSGMIGPTAEARGLTQILSLNQIIAYMSASDEERQQQLKAFSVDAATMDIPPDAAEKWAKFTAAMETAEKTIGSVLANGLVGLAHPLANLSSSISDFISGELGSEGVKEGIEKLRSGVQWLDTELGSKEAKEYMSIFLSGLVELNKVAGRALSIIVKLGHAGYDVYRLFNDPNYHPTAKQFGGDVLAPLVAPFAPNAQPAPKTVEPDETTKEKLSPGKEKSHEHPSIRWGTGHIHLTPTERASQAPLHKSPKLSGPHSRNVQPMKLPGAVEPTPLGQPYTPYPPDLSTGKQGMISPERTDDDRYRPPQKLADASIYDWKPPTISDVPPSLPSWSWKPPVTPRVSPSHGWKPATTSDDALPPPLNNWKFPETSEVPKFSPKNDQLLQTTFIQESRSASRASPSPLIKVAEAVSEPFFPKISSSVPNEVHEETPAPKVLTKHYIHDQKVSMLDHLRGARTAHTIIIQNETGGQATVSTKQIPVSA